MEQTESPPDLEENAGSPKCESLAPAVDPLKTETGTAGKNVEDYKQLCQALLRRWHNLNLDTKQRLRLQLRRANASKDNIVTIELSDDDDEVSEESNTKADDAAETELGNIRQKNNEESKSAIDLVTKMKNVTIALSANDVERDESNAIQKNLSEDLTTSNVREQAANDETPSKNDEVSKCVVEEKNIVTEDELQAGGGKVQNLEQQSLSEDVMPIVDILEQDTGDEDVSKRVDIDNENSQIAVHPIREIIIDTLHLSKDKPEADEKRDSKLLHKSQYKHRVVNKDISDQNIVNQNPKKQLHARNKNVKSEDHLIVQKTVYNKRQKVRTNHSKDTVRKVCAVKKSNSVKSNKQLNENSPKVSEKNNFNVTLNASDDLDDICRLFSSPKSTVLGEYLRIEGDPGLEADILVDKYVNKTNARPGVAITSMNQGDKNTPSQESNLIKELQEIDVNDVVALIGFDSDNENTRKNNEIRGVKENIVNKYILENRSDRFIKTYSAIHKNATRGNQETTNIGTFKTLQNHSRENSSTLNENNGIKTNEGYNRIKSDRFIKTYSAIHKNATRGNQETTNIETFKTLQNHSRENSSTLNETNGIKTNEGYNRIKRRNSCDNNKNAATISKTSRDNNNESDRHCYSHNKKQRKREQNQLSKSDEVNWFEDRNNTMKNNDFSDTLKHINGTDKINLKNNSEIDNSVRMVVDMYRHSGCNNSASAGLDNAGVEVLRATDPKLLMRPAVAIRKLTEQIWDEMALKNQSMSPTQTYEASILPPPYVTPPSATAPHKSSSPPMTPRSSPYPSTHRGFSTAGPKSVKKKRAWKKLLKTKEEQINEKRNEKSSMRKRVELPDIEEVRRHNRNMLTAQVTPFPQHQGGPITAVNCCHNKSPYTSSSTASLEGCSCCAAHRLVPPEDTGGGKLHREAASRARSCITPLLKKRKYILGQRRIKDKPVIFGVKPYHKKRKRRGRPRLTSPDNVSSDLTENMTTRDLIIPENEQTYRRNNPVAHSETVSPNDTASNLNENMPTGNLILQNVADITHRLKPVTHFHSVYSNDARVAMIENSSTQNLTTVQKELKITRNFNPVADVVSVPRNDDLSDLIEDIPTQSLSMAQKEDETTHSYNSVLHSKFMPSNVAPAVLVDGVQKQKPTTAQKEHETTPHSNPVTQFEASNAIKCVSKQNLSKSQKEQETARHSKRVAFNIPMQDDTATSTIQKKIEKYTTDKPVKIGVNSRRKQNRHKHKRSKTPDDPSSSSDESELMRDLIILDMNYETSSLNTASSNYVHVLDEGVPTRELTTTQIKQETNRSSNRDKCFASVPSIATPISNEGLPTQGLTVVCYRNTRTFEFFGQSTLNARDSSAVNNNVPTQDTITKQNELQTALQSAIRNASVPSRPTCLIDKRDVCKDTVKTNAYLKEQRNTADSMLYASMPLTKKEELCEERERPKQSCKFGFKPLLFRRGSVSKKGSPTGDLVSPRKQGTTNFSNTYANNPEVLESSEGNCIPLIVNIQSLASQKPTNESILHTPAPESIVQRQTPTITLKRAQPVFASNLRNSSDKRQLFTPEDLPHARHVTQHLSKAVGEASVIDFASASIFDQIKVQSVERSSEKSPLATITSQRATPVYPSLINCSPSKNQGFSIDSCINTSLPVITLKQAKPVCASDLTNTLREMHDFTSDFMGPEEMTQQLPKIINVSSLEDMNVRENSHNRDAALKRTIALNPTSTEQAVTKVKRESNVPIQSQQVDRIVETLGPQSIQPKALPTITLKRAQPVYAYPSSSELEMLISDSREEAQHELHLPRVGEVTGDLHVLQPDDRMGLHLVVSQEEVCNDNLNISHIFK